MRTEELSQITGILFRIGKAVGSREPLSQTLSTISRLVTELAGADACSILLCDGDKRRLLGKAAFGLHRRDVAEVSFRFGEGVAGWVAQTREPALIHDVAADERFLGATDRKRIRSLACVPLVHRDHLVGVMTVTAEKVGSFDQSTLDLMQLVATTIAIDIENIRLRRAANTDALTGAYNRKYLDKQLPRLIAQARERGQPLSVAMFDVDFFKKVNDEHGHHVGDLVLQALAGRLQRSSRDEDVLVRFGGEEFLLLLPDADLEKAREVAERLRCEFEGNPVGVEEARLQVHVSAGVTSLADDDSPEEFFERADQALYAAKRNGRNRVEVAP